MNAGVASIKRVAPIVRANIGRIFEGRLVDCVEDTGGAGLCRHASRELLRAVGRGRLLYLDFERGTIEVESEILGVPTPFGPVRALPPWAARYRWGPRRAVDYAHVVAEIDGVIVDLTARQFGRWLPFPMFATAPPR